MGIAALLSLGSIVFGAGVFAWIAVVITAGGCLVMAYSARQAGAGRGDAASS